MSNPSTLPADLVPAAASSPEVNALKVATQKAAPELGSPWPPPPDQARDKDYRYIVESYVWNGTIAEARVLTPARLVVEKLADGWERLFLASAITGNPKKYIQIWKVPREVRAREVPPALYTNYEEFFDKISEYERVELDALAHDPHHSPHTPPERPAVAATMMVVRANIRDGAMATVEYWKDKFFVPTVTEELGWKLHFAGYITSSSIPGSTLIQAWQMPDATSLGKAMIKMAHESIYVNEIGSCIVREDQNFYSVVQGAD